MTGTNLETDRRSGTVVDGFCWIFRRGAGSLKKPRDLAGNAILQRRQS